MNFKHNKVLVLDEDDKKKLLADTRRELMENAMNIYKKLVDRCVNAETRIDYWKLNDSCLDALDRNFTYCGKGIWGSLAVDDPMNKEWRKIFDEFQKELNAYSLKTKGVHAIDNPLFPFLA